MQLCLITEILYNGIPVSSVWSVVSTELGTQNAFCNWFIGMVLGTDVY